VKVLVRYKHDPGCPKLGSMALRQSPQGHSEPLSSLDL
jgi:hypothetical protein